MSVSTPELIATAEQRRGVGLDFWVDGTMGIVRRADSTLVIAPNGPRLARHVVFSGDLASELLGGLRSPSLGIEGLPDDVDHASGGPLLYDEGGDQLVLVYHGERFPDGDPHRYRSFLGLAVSDDDGHRFRDLGPIVTIGPSEGDRSDPAVIEVGPGALLVRGGYVHVYFQDRGIGVVRTNLAIARAPLAEVHACAAAGRSPAFAKYSGKGFDEPGLGGRAAELFDVDRKYIAWFDIIHLEPFGLDAMVFSTADLCHDGTPEWNHAIVVSRDGLNWSDPMPLLDEAERAETIYVTDDSRGPDQRTSTDGTFDLYRTRATTAFRWDDARLERLRVTVRLA